MSVPLRKIRFPVDCRFLVEEPIANIGIPLDFLDFCSFDLFGGYDIFVIFWVFANQPTVYNGDGGVSRGTFFGFGS